MVSNETFVVRIPADLAAELHGDASEVRDADGSVGRADGRDGFFTRFDAVQERHGLSDEQLMSGQEAGAAKGYWRDCLEVLRSIKVCDPACGSGAVLIRAYDALFHHYSLAITELAE